ncbi:acyl-CoA thioesterase [Psychroflexus aestuariivivens]|uniref:acyl-CoA thioesterase n=1 Tax=Psychroflexus aestuariivivens TaxID=1795040 RepID=UPI000FD8B745|nr:thioesterase family protein [Psychroflexus aestuariivivens]
MKALEFKKEIKVTAGDLDIQNHVNNLRFMEWVVDVSESHWVKQTDAKTREKFAWFVVDHYIKYKQQAFLDEQLILKTWVESCGLVKSIRCVNIIRKSDQKVIVEAKSTWCFIDRNTQKPTLITDDILQAFFEKID